MQTALVTLDGSLDAGAKLYDSGGDFIGKVIKTSPFILTKTVFDEIPDGEVFKIITTNLQTVHKPFKTTLKFLCKKGHGNDWAIYYGLQYTPDYVLATSGDKVTSEKCIQEICPCDPEVLARYRY